MLKGAVLYAKDLEKLVTFYSALGGDVVEVLESDFAVIKALGADLIIVRTPDHVSSQIEIANPLVVRSGTPIKLVISVPSIDLALETVSDSGGTILPGASQWKFRDNLVQDIVDPEGNVVQFWQPTSGWSVSCFPRNSIQKCPGMQVLSTQDIDEKHNRSDIRPNEEFVC